MYSYMTKHEKLDLDSCMFDHHKFPVFNGS